MVNTKTGENEFRIYKLQKGTTDLTKSGNWEKAFKFKNNTLVGGMHGNEKVTSIKFYQDTKQINPYINRKYTGERVVIIENSNFYNPKNTSQVICTANTFYTWHGHNLNINTQYNWMANETVETLYSGMFPTNNAIFHYGMIEGYPLQKLVNNGGKFTTDKTSSKVTVWNGARNFYMSMKTSKTGSAWVRCMDAYNKIYLAWVHGGEIKVTKGTVWNTNTLYMVGNC